MSECEKCHGTGKVTCPKCGGKKEVKCEECNGTGRHECHSCSGSGKERCSRCGGSGNEISICPVCYRGKVERSRWINCACCHGKGVVYYGSNPHPYSCEECDGRGQVKETYEIECPHCKGAYRQEVGTCKKCGGTGRQTCSSCGGEKIVQCRECSGKGIHDCHNCKSVGRVKCPNCEKREQEAKEKKERIEAAKRRKWQEAADRAREIAQRKSERNDAMLGCGCLLAIIAVIGFFIWWWVEGLTMSALPGMWEQVKNMIAEGALGTAAKLGGAVVVLLIALSLIKRIKGKKGDVSTSPKKRWKFVVLGILFGFFGIHLAYAKRWLLFLLLWTGLISGNVMTHTKSATEEDSDKTVARQVEPSDKAKSDGGSQIGGLGLGIWALLWIGGTLFIKKDGKGNRM